MQEKKESDTQVLTRSSLLKKVLLGLVTAIIGLASAGIAWVCGTVLTLQGDMATTKADVKTTKELIEERFKEKPEDMALWQQVHEHEKKLRELEIKNGINEGLWKAVHGGKMKLHNPEPPDVNDDKPREESREPQKPEEKEDTRIFRERHLHPWIQQQQANEPLRIKGK